MKALAPSSCIALASATPLAITQTGFPAERAAAAIRPTAERPRGEQGDVDGNAVEGGMLLIDDDEVVAEAAQDLDRVTGGRLDEGAEQVLACHKALPKSRGRRPALGHRIGPTNSYLYRVLEQ